MIKEVADKYERLYSAEQINGVSLLEWAVRWYTTDNDTFYRMYGFNFTPYKYPYLYEIARKKVYGE